MLASDTSGTASCRPAMLHVGKFDIPAGTFCGLLFMPGLGFIWEFRMKNFDSRAVLLMVAVALSTTAPAAADPVADFYKGKTISESSAPALGADTT
jgi:hypothetical protein